jgi:hypothetical protein
LIFNTATESVGWAPNPLADALARNNKTQKCRMLLFALILFVRVSVALMGETLNAKTFKVHSNFRRDSSTQFLKRL